MSDPACIKIQSEIEQLLHRAVLYQAASFFLYHPAVMAKHFSLEDGRDSWQQVVERVDWARKEELKIVFYSLMKELEKTTRRQWIQEYEQCLGHTAQGRVPCYELEYGEEHSRRQPQQLGDIAAFYHAFGMQINEQAHERVDHIAVECEFMQYLLFKQAYALEHQNEEMRVVCQEARSHFLADHLGLWFPAFARKLAKHAQRGIMKETADFLLLFATLDCQSQGIVPGHPDIPVRGIQLKEDAGCVSCGMHPDAPC